MGEVDRIPVEEAIKLLNVVQYDPGGGVCDCVHTIRGGTGIMLGAHWDLDQTRAAFEKYGVERAGANAEAMGHGLVMEDETGPVFFETKRRPTE